MTDERDKTDRPFEPFGADLITPVDKPFPYTSIREMIDKKREAKFDCVANDPETVAALEASKNVTSLAAAAKARELVNMPIDHHTREPNQSTTATIVEGEYCNSNNDPGAPVPYEVALTCKGPGQVEFTLKIDGAICGRMPFDNLVKAATRVDPDHAVGSEKQIRDLRQDVADAKARMYEWQARATVAEERVAGLDDRIAVLEENLKAFQEASKA